MPSNGVPWPSEALSQRVLRTHMGYTYPNHKRNYYYRNHTLYHIGTLDPLGLLGRACSGCGFGEFSGLGGFRVWGV